MTFWDWADRHWLVLLIGAAMALALVFFVLLFLEGVVLNVLRYVGAARGITTQNADADGES